MHPMTFRKYPSLINHYKIDSQLLSPIDLTSVQRWFVTEKIHGANFGVYYDGETVRFARRQDFLSIGESFFNYQSLESKMHEACLLIYEKLLRPFILYGELCGGVYDNVIQGAKIQAEVQYFPSNQFLVFDIYDYLVGEFFSPNETWDLVSETNLEMVPTITVCATLEEALAVDVNILSEKLQRATGLVPMANNFIEGVVIRPNKDVYTSNGMRLIIKKKSARFADAKEETKHLKKLSHAVDGVWVHTFAAVHIDRLLTPARTLSAISKHGRDIKLMRVLIIEMTNDVLAELGSLYTNLIEAKQALVRRYLGAKIPKILREEITR